LKLNVFLTINAVTWIAIGIAFGLYAPIVLAFFGVPEIPSKDIYLYWTVASYARLFGVAQFSLGLIVWALRSVINIIPEQAARGILFSLLFGNILGAFTTVIQSVAIWRSPTGWLLAGIFIFFTFGYGYFLAKQKQPS
jgi:hypothetical protein